MSTITKEQLSERARGKVKSLEFAVTQTAFADSRAELEEELELARIALASLEAEPVAWIVHARTGDQLTTDGGYVANAEGILGLHSTPLYTAPPAPESVPDERVAFNAWNNDTDCPIAGRDAKTAAWLAWSRRAAMLQGADGNSPVIPDGWVACSKRMPDEGSKVIVFRPRAEESNDPPVKTATYKGGREYYHGFDCYCEPTHWMPLPAAPQQEV